MPGCGRQGLVELAAGSILADTMSLHRHAKRRKIGFARAMRRKPTKAEAAMWELLRAQQLGVVFWRQVVLLGWIVDFWCPAARLIIEVDGSSHKGRGRYDARRSNVLWEELDAQTVRFTNEEVLADPATVQAKLRRLLLARGRSS